MLRIAAGKGDIDAMERLADLYQRGDEGVPKDVEGGHRVAGHGGQVRQR